MLFRSPDGEIVQVKVGFSWQAFFVGSLRTLITRGWLILVAMALAYFIFAWMGASFALSSRNIGLMTAVLGVYFCYMVCCGIYGNRWLVASLLRRGFRQTRQEQK